MERVREICDRYGVLMIVDEVITGFGRTGKLFAVEHSGVRPDLMTLAKGITSGYLPLGATVASEQVFERFLSARTTKTRNSRKSALSVGTLVRALPLSPIWISSPASASGKTRRGSGLILPTASANSRYR